MGLFQRIRSLFQKTGGNRRPSRAGLKSPGGMTVVASCGGEHEELPEPTDELRVEPLSDELVTYKCGHRGADRYLLNAFGEELMPGEESLAAREKCPECLTADARANIIRCALCGHHIMPGEPVALYVDDGGFNPKWMTKLGRDVVGCLRWDCCPSGGFFSGHWDGEKVLPAFGEYGSAVEQAFKTGQVVCGNIEDLKPGPKKP